MANIFNPQHNARNPFGGTNGASAQSANDQYMRGLGGGIGQSTTGFRYSKPQKPRNTAAPAAAPAAQSMSIGGAQAPQAQSVSQMAATVAGDTSGAHGTAAGVPNYQTSIEAKPIWNDQQKQQAMNQARTNSVHAYQNPSSTFAQSQMSANTRMGPGSGFARAQAENAGLMGHFLGERNASEADRAMTAQNAQHLLGAQQARAGEGISLANLLQSEKMQQQAIQAQREAAAQNQGMNLIGMLMGGMLG